MASTIERVRESLDPQTAANAVYEILLLWHEANHNVEVIPHTSRTTTRKWQAKRVAYEECLSLFLGVSLEGVQVLLRDHYQSGAKDG